MKPETIAFDFGGCLDSDGMHSRKLFFNHFKHYKLILDSEEELFQDSYTRVDQAIYDNGLVLSQNLSYMNQIMCQMIAEDMALKNSHHVDRVSEIITSVQSHYLDRNRSVLSTLSQQFQLGIISNFPGNLEIILKDFNLFNLLDFVLDSYHEGYQKPDHRLFKKALELSQKEPQSVCFVGDNIKRDIDPAHLLNMRTILISEHINSPQHHNADFHITSLPQLLELDIFNRG